MAKQIKIGLDKVPAPLTKKFTQLVDIEGTKLFDAAGNPLVTAEDESLQAFTTSDNALSVYTNNTPLDGGSIPVVEQFPETSQVSSSLLGVPRGEEQLSLFSDVATYGLDEDSWNEYTFSDITVPYQWYRKKHPIHGRRSNPEFKEGSKEQALFLRTFPSQYSYPRGPRSKLEDEPTEGFRRYMNFIALGRYFYNLFQQRGFTDFAERWFLDPVSASVIDRNTPANILTDDELRLLDGTTLTFIGNQSFYDVNYGKDDIQDSFDDIETWTYFFEKIKRGTAYFPSNTVYGRFDEEDIYPKIVAFATNECLPGGSSTRFQVACLESKRAFRYQPGRASGFTFGSRITTDPISAATVCELGCANDTDQYMFQLRGTQLNIVRRSTIPMPIELLERQNLTQDDQTTDPIYIRGIGNDIPLYETVIPRSKWNGDALLGTGDSGYILSFEDVTMYKIEFSWYGAIGAKFYAYIPSGNGEARWALLHTLIIENGMGQPVLQNPDFKFKYTLYSTNTATIESPILLYKYGSSYYIDGGDEGTQHISTVSSDNKSFSSRTPVLGLLPKNDILNLDGVPVKNGKKSYPTTLSVNSTKDCRIDIMDIQGCSDGVHFNYSPSIHMDGRNPRTRELTLRYGQGDTVFNIVQPSNNLISGTVAVNIDEKVVTGTGTSFQSDLQVGDLITIGEDELEHKINRIVSDTELTLSDDYTNTDSADVTGQQVRFFHKFNPEDTYGKFIADGVYGQYLNSANALGTTAAIMRRQDPSPDFSLVEGIDVRDALKLDFSILDRTQDIQGYLTNYHTVVGSDTPIFANKFKIHFLNPNKKEGTYSTRHFAEFTVGVTPHKPTPPDGIDTFDRLHFETSPGVFEEYNREDYPSVEYVHDRVRFLEKQQAEYFEWHGAYGRGRFEVDPRNPIPVGSSTQSGFISSVVGEVTIQSFTVSDQLGDYVEDDGTQYQGLKRLIFASGNTPSNNDIKFTDTLSDGQPDPTSGISEIGAQFVGTGFFFKSPIITPASGSKYVYVDPSITSNSDGVTLDDTLGPTTISAESGNTKTIQTKIITLKDDFQAQSFDDNGTSLFPYHTFNVSQAIAFNDQPLYPVFALQDNAHINGVVIEEIFDNGEVICHTPTFKTDDSSYNPNINIDNSIPESDRSLPGHSGDPSSTSLKTPQSFNEEDRMSALRFDKTCQNPLRSGNTITSFFVEGGDPAKIDLSNIFAQDRKGLSTGLLNTSALYFTATELDDQTAQGNVELALTIKEQ